MNEDPRIEAVVRAFKEHALVTPARAKRAAHVAVSAADAVERQSHNDVATDMEEALENLLFIVNDSQGVIGFHLNGEVATWDEFEEEVSDAEQALAKARGDTE